MEQNQQSTAEQYSEQIEQLMELGRTQGYLTYAEINDLLPEDVIDPEYYDKLLQTLASLAISSAVSAALGISIIVPTDRKSTRLNSSHVRTSRMPSSA